MHKMAAMDNLQKTEVLIIRGMSNYKGNGVLMGVRIYLIYKVLHFIIIRKRI